MPMASPSTQQLLWRQLSTTSRPSCQLPSAASLSRSTRPQRSYSTQPPKKGNFAAVKFWPFVLIIAGGFGGYAMLVQQRADAAQAEMNRRLGRFEGSPRPRS